MGQAKQRGTFEERKALAIVRNRAEAKVRREYAKKQDKTMTPEQYSMRALMALTIANSRYMPPKIRR